MIAADIKQLLAVVHDDQPILIKIGEQLVEIKEMRRIANHNGKVAQAFVPVALIIETK